MAQLYAYVKPNGKVITLTYMTAQTAAELGARFVRTDDTSLQEGDLIDTTTGVLISRNVRDTQESRQQCREQVRQLMRESDWTQVTDTVLTNAKKALWATYRSDLKANWATAKATSDPLGTMVWPVAPGDASDGL